jgi:hypothetical protein
VTSGFHHNQTIVQGLHSIVAFSYDNAIDRNAATGFSDYDLYKLAIDLDDNTFWIILDVDGYGEATWQNIVASTGGAVGGDLSGTLPNPTVIDLHITGQQQGSVLFYNGTHWVVLNPGTDGTVLTTHDTGENPTWSPVITDLNVAGQAQGDLLYFDGSNWVVLAAGSDGYVLTAQGVGEDPIWSPSVGGGGINISAGTQIATTGTIAFVNSNGITFGMSNSNQITAIYTVPSIAGLISNVNISGGTTSNNLSALVFSNSNNVSFGLNGSTITGSIPNQTAYVFSNSNGLSFGTNGSTITGSYTVPSTAGLLSAVNVSGGTTSNNLSAVVFSNSNNVSFGLNGSTITASVPAQSNQTAGLYALGNTTQNSSTTLDVRSLSFNGIGAATVGYSNGSIQISVPVQTAQTQNNIQAIYDGANSISTGTIRFVNANGVTFSINGQTISGSVAAQTNQSIGLYAVSNTTGASSSTTADARSLSFQGAGVASVGYSNGSVVISVPSGIANINVSAGTTSNNLTNVVFSNSNNVSFGLNGSTITATISVPAQTAQTIGLYGLGNTTQNSSTTLDARTLSFNGLGGNTVGYSNGSIQISGVTTAGLISGVNLSAGTTSNNLTAFTLSNSNGLSFGLNGSVVTGSYTVPTQSNQTEGMYAIGNTVGQSSSSTFDARTLSVSGAGIASVGYSGNALVISVPSAAALINFSAGTTSNNLGAVIFSNSNNISFGLNGSTITASASRVRVSQLHWPETPWQTNFPISNESFSLQHFNAKLDVVATQANLLMALTGSTNSTGALTISLGIYTMNGSTMSLASSDSRQITWSSGSQTTASSLYGGISGTRFRTVGLNNWSISAGDYVLGMWFRTTNNGNWNAFGIQGPTIVGAEDINETNNYGNGYSVSSYSTAMVASVNVTDTNYVRTGGNAFQQPGIIFLGTF